MIDDIAQAIRTSGPLRIREVYFSYPSVVLNGEQLSLALLCPWIARKDGKQVFAWGDKDLEDAVWDLVGNDIIAVRQRSPGNDEDPTFELTNGWEIEIMADSDLDPWVFKAAGAIFVGRKPRSVD